MVSAGIGTKKLHKPPWKSSFEALDRGALVGNDHFLGATKKAIGDLLAELRTAERSPDVIMLQEAFISASMEILTRGDYPNWVAGSNTNELGDKYSERATEDFIMEHSFRKGEKLGKWQPSGLILASNFPILRLYNHPFNQWECVGFDCLPNKGVLAVMLDVPGVPEAVAYATMHYNSRGASGVNPERALIAHNLQVDETNEFPAGLDKPGIPFIWAGDLNMRHADDRIKFFVERFNGKLNEVSSFCVKKPGRCKIVMRWDTDTPWYETQDLQGWLSGNRVKVQPIRVEQLFDEPVDGIMPSDHNALLVTYRLIWSLETIGS